MELQIECPPTHREGAKILLVGEAPGEEEVKQGQGFVGKSGELLQHILRMGGIGWEECSLTNVVKRRPANNDFQKEFYVTEKVKGKKRVIATEEYDAWVCALREELRVRSYPITVAVGNRALQALCGLSGIFGFQGSVITSAIIPGRKVIPIVHPAAILHGNLWQQVYLSGRIAQRIKQESEFPEIRREPYGITLDPDYEQVDAFLHNAASTDRWVIDFETPLKATPGSHAKCFAVAYTHGGYSRALCIPITRGDTPKWPWGETERIWERLRWLLDKNPNVVMHNALFDSQWLWRYGVEVENVYMDTMLAFHTLYPELPKDLGTVAMLYTDMPYFKGGHKFSGLELWEYNCLDCIATLRASYALEQEIRGKEKKAFSQDI